MFFRRLNWNVVGWFRTVSAISYVLIGLGLAFMAWNWVHTGAPLRLGLSFTGGTDATIRYTQPVDKDKIVAALATVGVTDAKINTLSKTGEPVGERWTIETQKDFGNDSSPLKNALGDGRAGRSARCTSVSTVGPSLSHEYLFNALKALVIAIAIQFLYIAFRFGWNLIFGWVCVVALVRDSLMMIGIYAIAGKRVDDAFLAAVLTVVGYSVMDTIVILDRIRENVKVMDGKPFDQIVNTSILQTMTRSVNTLATVVITLVALLAFGGASLQNFAFALLVGICSGGYHSIFYSAPLVAVLQKRSAHRAIFRKSALVPAAHASPRRARKPPARRPCATARRSPRPARRAASASATPPPSGRRSPRATSARAKKRSTSRSTSSATSAPRSAPPRAGDAEMDPLDAQALGLHDEAAELGHEEITLNLGDEHELGNGTPHADATAPLGHDGEPAPVGHDAKPTP